VRYVMGTSGDREPSAQLTDQALAAEVSRKARCADGTVDPDEWFPVSTDAEAARREAASAIAICTACPVRGMCLELSLRHWTIGQHGVWGGLVAADRAALRRRWLASPHDYGRALSSMRALRMARALLRHLMAAPPAGDQARPGGRSIPPAASVPQMGPALARPLPAVDAAAPGGDDQARALAQWQGPGPAPRTGEVLATSGLPAGSAVTVWLDASGKLTGPPLQPGQITDRTIAVAALAPAVLALSLLAALPTASPTGDGWPPGTQPGRR
jgi:hypothetical protein